MSLIQQQATVTRSSAGDMQILKSRSGSVSVGLWVLGDRQGLSETESLGVLKDDAVKVLHSIFQQIWKTQQWPQDWKRSVFIPIPKKGNAK